MINTSRQIGAGAGAALLPAIALTASHGGRVAGLATLIALAHRRKPAAPAGCP